MGFSQVHPAHRNPAKITNAEKDFPKKHDFKNKYFPVKVRDIRKIEKKNSIDINAFGYEKYPIYLSKTCCEEKHTDILLIGEEAKRHYVLIKDFNTFMYNHTLKREKNLFCRYCLQGFSAEEILKRHFKDCYEINGKRRIIMS